MAAEGESQVEARCRPKQRETWLGRCRVAALHVALSDTPVRTCDVTLPSPRARSCWCADRRAERKVPGEHVLRVDLLLQPAQACDVRRPSALAVGPVTQTHAHPQQVLHASGQCLINNAVEKLGGATPQSCRASKRRWHDVLPRQTYADEV